MEILPNLYQVDKVIANTFLLIDPDGLILIDVGLPRSTPKILHTITSLGYSADDLKAVLLTHSDSDHVGSLAAIQAKSSAQTCAHQIEAEAIQIGRLSRPLKLSGWKKWLYNLSTRFFRITPGRVDKILQGEEVLPYWGGLQVIETPGHTPGHMSFFSPAKGILFCGDSLRCSTDVIRISRGANTWDESRALTSAQKQAALNPQVVCAGHGPVIFDAVHKFSLPRSQKDAEEISVL